MDTRENIKFPLYFSLIEITPRLHSVKDETMTYYNGLNILKLILISVEQKSVTSIMHILMTYQ